jgi:hypothetical protein
LSGYVETFRDDFNAMSVTRHDGAGPWYASVHANFNNTWFREPDFTPNPFLCENGALRIRLEKTASGKWQSGIIQTMNAAGQGFAQQFGYFEARIKLPQAATGLKGAPGFWGGPWLKGANDFNPQSPDHMVELDICESYGGDTGMHTTVHVIPRWTPQLGDYPKRQSDSTYCKPSAAISSITKQLIWTSSTSMYDGQFHDFGLLIDEEGVTSYFDGYSISRFPMLDYWRQPLYFLIDSTINPDTVSAAVSPMDMYVEHVRVMAKA